MRFKRIAASLTAALMLSGTLSAYAEGLAVYVNGNKMQSDAVEVNGEVYISLEELAEKLGASAVSDEKAQSVSLDFTTDTAVVKMIEEVSESVVAIVGNYKDSSLSSDAQDYNELYAHGAGAVIDSEGVILTNAHVVDEIQNLTVIFGDGRTYSGTVLYSDEISDLALVKINAKELKPIVFAPEGSLKVGETVVAIGTPLSVNLINSATKGIVSGTGVNISQHYLFTQSDVAINGGNSGGPLVNMKGELVGVNSIKYVGSEIEGMSFSIPVDTINYVLESFKNYGRVIRPETGITMTESWESKIGVPTTKGLTVTTSENGMINAGDMITHVNGYEVHSIADYNEALKKSFDGNAIEVTYIRGEKVETALIESETKLEREPGGRVEISLVAGDEHLMINGFAYEVEAPYITGEGTTLVPLRVITEAFGASVKWDGETQSVQLTYPEMIISLQIGNNVANVNGEEVTLPVAPTLEGNGVTMVPLRFVSEAFGATVNYDGETGRITVVREAEEESGTIKFSTNLPRVGDSYWSWSMLTPTSMMMSDRSLDGKETAFYDEGGFVALAITDYAKDDSYEKYTSEQLFDEVYDDSMYYYYDMTLSRNETGTDALGNKYFRITGRSKYSYYDCYTVVRDKTVFEVMVYSDVEATQLKTYTSILESFRVEFADSEENAELTYDLSNVDEDGYRPMADEELKISCKLPADFSEGYTSYYSVNTLSYSDEDGESLDVTIYSKSDTVTAESVAKGELEFVKKYYNGEVWSISEIKEYDVSFGNAVFGFDTAKGELEEETEEITEEATEEATGEDTEEVTEEATEEATGEATEDKDKEYVTHVMFFEKGEYVYEMRICEEKGKGEFFKKVMETLEVKELDSKKTGTFMYKDKSFTEKKFSDGEWSFTLNSGWTKDYAYGTYASYTNEFTSAELEIDIAEAEEVEYTSAKSAAESELKYLKTYYDEDNIELLKSVTQVNLGSNSFYTFSVKTKWKTYYGEEITEYRTIYVMKKSGKFYGFTLLETEAYANAQTKKDVEAALGTFTVEAK